MYIYVYICNIHIYIYVYIIEAFCHNFNIGLGSRQFLYLTPRAFRALRALRLGAGRRSLALRLKIAQKPYVIWSLGPQAFKYEALEP